MTRRILTAGAALAALLVATHPASAQTYPPPGGGYGSPPGYGPPPPAPPERPGVHRDGFVIGFGIGGGTMIPADCDSCEGENGFSAYFKIGGMISPRLAILFDGSDVVSPRESVTLIHAIYTVALQFWLTPQLWIEGGLGLGVLAASYDDGFDYYYDDVQGGAGMIAIGFEVVQSRSFVMDVQLRAGATTFQDQDFGDDFTLQNFSLMLGFNWY